MTEIPEYPGPELLLWGLSHKNYTRIRDWMSGQAHNGDEVTNSYELFADRLNKTGVPPLDGEDNWTACTLHCITTAIASHARDVQQTARLRTVVVQAQAELQRRESLSDNLGGPSTLSISEDANVVEEWDEEAVAALIVAELLGGSPTKRDIQAGPNSSGVHDYDIELLDGRLIALEITQEADSPSRQQVEYLKGHDLKSDCLRYQWSVELDHRCDVRPVHRDLAEMLARLETLEIRYLRVSSSRCTAPFIQKLRALGVESVRMHDESVRQSEICVSPQLGSGPLWHPDAFAHVANHALGRKAKKLRKACADERHLWIWIDYSLGPSQMPDPVGRLPSTLPDMSAGGPGQGVDVVWIAVSRCPCTVILKSDGTQWNEVELPDEAQRSVEEAIQRSCPR